MVATTNDHGMRAADLVRGALWITGPVDEHLQPGTRPAYEFRRRFTLESTADTATLAVTAHGIYEAFINGVRVGDDELTPGLTSYHSTLAVQRYQVASLLRGGPNEMKVVVSDGWFRGRCGASRMADHFGRATAVIARLDVECDDGGLVVVSDESWEVGVGPILAADLMDGQVVDLRRTTVEWSPVSLADTELTRNAERLTLSSAPPVRRTREYASVEVTRLPSGRQVVDFGTTVNGWVRLENLGPRDTRTDLTHGEWLTPEGDLDVTHAAYTRWPDGGRLRLGQRDTVISGGAAGDVFEPRHTTHGFRYVAVDGRSDDIAPTDIRAIMVRSDLRRTAWFRCSDARLNQLHDIAVQSWLVNSCDVPTDCPQRERWGYTGDYQIFVHTAAFLEDVDQFSRKWLRSLADEQHESGLITNVAPVCGVDPILPDLDGAAGWGDAATVVPWELYLAYGDAAILSENIAMMTRWLDYVAGRAMDHRHPSRQRDRAVPAAHEVSIWDTGWQWGEWHEPDHEFDADVDKGIVATAYFKHSADIVAASFAALGEINRSQEYAALAGRVADAWRAEFVDRERERLTVDRQAHYVRALAFGLVEPDDRRWVIDRLVDLIEEADGHLTTGFLSTGMLLPTLADNGYAKVAYRLLRQDTAPSWMTMLDRGATAVWEAWNGVDEAGIAHDSLAHYSKGAVVTFLHEYVAGLRQLPGSTGWQHFSVAPRPDAHLESAELAFDSRRGRIEVRWFQTRDGMDLTIVVPPGSTAQVSTPSGKTWSLAGGTHHLVG